MGKRVILITEIQCHIFLNVIIHCYFFSFPLLAQPYLDQVFYLQGRKVRLLLLIKNNHRNVCVVKYVKGQN
ncbi:hypothetical protein BCR42DRAFT_403592, partial [Absidia repens]